jgi:hypothetical protein
MEALSQVGLFGKEGSVACRKICENASISRCSKVNFLYIYRAKGP